MPERTRVVHFVKGLGPGGAERLLVELVEVADHAAFEHRVVYALAHKDQLVPDLESRGAAVTHVPLRDLAGLRRVLADADVAHLHSPLVAAAARVAARTLPTRRRPATVSTEHNRWPAFALATRLANAATFLLDAHHFAVSSDAAASVWRPWRRHVEVLVHGVAVERVARHRAQRDAVRARLGLAADEVAVVTVANYRREKDHATLLHAARRIADAGAPVRFLVVGQGPLAAAVEARHRELGLAGTVELLGYRADALDVLAAADLFALSSTHEGLPVALMEALVLGVPVVATAVGGVPDAVTSGVEGLLVPPRDPAALADAVLALAGNAEERRRMGEAAEARGAAFDIRVAATRLEAVYDAVARERPRAGRR